MDADSYSQARRRRAWKDVQGEDEGIEYLDEDEQEALIARLVEQNTKQLQWSRYGLAAVTSLFVVGLRVVFTQTICRELPTRVRLKLASLALSSAASNLYVVFYAERGSQQSYTAGPLRQFLPYMNVFLALVTLLMAATSLGIASSPETSRSELLVALAAWLVPLALVAVGETCREASDTKKSIDALQKFRYRHKKV